MKEYFVLVFVLIVLDYSFANTEDCPHHTFQELHRCLKYDGAKPRQCTDEEVLALAKIAEKKPTGDGKPRLIHSVFYFDSSAIFNKQSQQCTSKTSLPKSTCKRPNTSTEWTCTHDGSAKPIHSTINGHYIGDA